MMSPCCPRGDVVPAAARIYERLPFDIVQQCGVHHPARITPVGRGPMVTFKYGGKFQPRVLACGVAHYICVSEIIELHVLPVIPMAVFEIKQWGRLCSSPDTACPKHWSGRWTGHLRKILKVVVIVLSTRGYGISCWWVILINVGGGWGALFAPLTMKR